MEPTSGFEPDPPVYEAGARPVELHGQDCVFVRVNKPVRGFSLEGKMPTQARPHRGAGGWSRTNDFVRVGSLRADEDGCPCLDSNQILPGKSRMLVLSSFKGRIRPSDEVVGGPIKRGVRVFKTQLV